MDRELMAVPTEACRGNQGRRKQRSEIERDRMVDAPVRVAAGGFRVSARQIGAQAETQAVGLVPVGTAEAHEEFVLCAEYLVQAQNVGVIWFQVGVRRHE